MGILEDVDWSKPWFTKDEWEALYNFAEAVTNPDPGMIRHKRPSLEVCILEVLSQGGYEFRDIVRRVRADRRTLYTVMRRLHYNGLIRLSESGLWIRTAAPRR